MSELADISHPENSDCAVIPPPRAPVTIEVHKATMTPVVVLSGKGVSKALTDAAKFACSSYSAKTKEKVIRWLRSYLSTWPDDVNIVIEETWDKATARFEDFMAREGCTFANPKGISRANGLMLVRRKDRDLTEPSIFINALEAFYRNLSDKGHRRAPNPMLVKDWEAYEPNTRAGITRRQNALRKHPTFRGVRYVMEQREPFKPKLYDPRGLRERILEAGEDWPHVVRTIFHVIADSGCRISEPLHLTVQDWWDGSKFGDVIRAPNKSSDGKRVKDLLLSPETVRMVESCFTGSGAGFKRRPSMEELRELVHLPWSGRMKNILLFEKAYKKPFDDKTLRDTYFKTTITKARILVTNKDGEADYATPHSLRHARIDEEIRKLDALYPDQERFLIELEEFAAHMHCTVQNIHEYAANAFRERSIRYRRKLMRERFEAEKDADRNGAPTVAEKLLARMQA